MRPPRPVLLLCAALVALAVLMLAGCARPATAQPPAATWNSPATSPTKPPSPSPSLSLSLSPSPSPARSTATGLPGAAPAGARPRVVTHGTRSGNKVALTFDADMTDAMLYNLASGRVGSYANLKVIETLELRQVPATFFVTGQWAERYPEVTRRLAAQRRFELANHSYEHQAFTANCYGLPQVPAHQMAEDVARTFRVLEPFGGRQTRYFRFPGGCYNDAVLKALAPLGMTVIQWDVVSGDPFATAATPIVHAVLSQVQPGSIVVLHVTEANAQYTDEALPQILDGLAAKGLEPVTVSELLNR